MASYTEEMSILEGKNFTIGDITLGKAKVNSSGGKNVPLYNKHVKRNLHLSTPLMLTWGVNENDFEGNGKKSYDMTLQFPNDDYKTEATSEFLENMINLEKFIKQSAIDNSKEWFNKTKITEEVVDALYTPIVKYPKYPKGHPQEGEFDLNRAPGLRIKLPFWSDNGFDVEIYDTNENKLFPSDDDSVTPLTLMPKMAHVALVVQCGGIWFANGKFGVTWRLFQGVVKPRPSLKGRCHIKLDTGDKKTLENQEDPVPAEAVDDSDVDDDTATGDVEPDPTDEPAPVSQPQPEPAVEDQPPVKKTRKVVKKKPAASS
tara:strand:+ start:14672 stop:15619 length:948 start_codon:yes stop_codon:yes gene_type:complete